MPAKSREPLAVNTKNHKKLTKNQTSSHVLHGSFLKRLNLLFCVISDSLCEDPLADFAARLRAQARPEHILRLVDKLDADAHNPPLRVGTGCSGIEIFLCALEGLCKDWGTELNRVLPYKHVFGVEQDEDKQVFLQDFWDCDLLFRKMEEMGEAYAWDVRSGQPQRVPDCDVLAAGFECDSISSLNFLAALNRKCAQTAININV